MMQLGSSSKTALIMFLVAFMATVGGCNVVKTRPLINKDNMNSSNDGADLPSFEESTLLTETTTPSITASINRKSDFFTTKFHEKIREDMSLFTFDLSAHYGENTDGYSLDKLIITNSATENIIQEISIPEFALFGHTSVSVHDKGTIGFKLEDLNFDGYKDIRLFDTANGNYRLEWIYFVWDPNQSIFINDARLNEISLANFDQDKQVIYGMERGSATDHYFSTYKYINGMPTLIYYFSQEFISCGVEKITDFLLKGDVKTNVTDIMLFHETVLERNDETGEMTITRDEYIFYPYSDEINENDAIAKFAVTSDIGKIIGIEE